MDDLLTAVKTVRSQPESEAERPLTAVHTREIKSERDARNPNIQVENTSQNGSLDLEEPASVHSPQDALQVIKSEPTITTLIAVLKQLVSGEGFDTKFTLALSGPVQSQIINSLINSIVPNFWPALYKEDKVSLTECLCNVSGINALVAKLRSTTIQPATQKGVQGSASDFLDVANLLLQGPGLVTKIWSDIQLSVSDATKRTLAWKEFVNTCGSGRIVAAVAQAEDTVRRNGRSNGLSSQWLAKGQDYSDWLGRNIAHLVASTADEDSGDSLKSSKAAGQLFLKGLSIGYPVSLISGLIRAVISKDVRSGQLNSGIERLATHMPPHGKRQLMEQTLKWLSNSVSPDPEPTLKKPDPQVEEVAAVASLLSLIVGIDVVSKQQFIDYMIDPVLTSSIPSVVRRAGMVTLSTVATDELSTLLEKLISTFGDPIFIKHAPVLQQDALAQTLLLASGYLHRHTPMAVLLTARSSGHMQGVSNRLDSSVHRPRWLGMVVGTALSSLVDKKGSQMNFGTDEMQSDEAKWYLNLININDHTGEMKSLSSLIETWKSPTRVRTNRARRGPRTEKLPIIGGKQTFGPPRPPQPAQTEVIGNRVVELSDGEASGDDSGDLKPYAKPDSDPEDSDEDATLVNRDKVRPPVYIRTLMAMLRDDQNHDRFQMGIKQAASLIRRKSSFGSEVKDHAEELLRNLCNLQDPFDTDNFDELRLQAMIAVLLSDFDRLGPWMSRQVFAGEYSLAQRCIMLSALGLGGRELAGLHNEDELNPLPPNTEFPSKRLPQHLHALYTPDSPTVKRLESAAKSLEHQLVQPMALRAADQTTAHLDAVKVRTFSSRMEIERTKRKPAANQLAKIFGPAIFLPLTGRYQQEIAAYGSGSVFASAPIVIVTFLKTLALLFHASGPATLELPQITTDYWDLLLSLRVRASSDKSVLEAVLFSFLTLLEINTDKLRIADSNAKQLMETQQWAELVFERTADEDGGGSEEEAKVRALLAGVLVKTREVVEAYQTQMFGKPLQ